MDTRATVARPFIVPWTGKADESKSHLEILLEAALYVRLSSLTGKRADGRSTFELLLIATALSTPGCSAFIALSGTSLQVLSRREQVHDSFGEPSVTQKERDKVVEEYRTRRKLSEPSAVGNLMAFVGTVGLSEFIAFPYELYQLGKTAVVGHELQFTYDETGAIIEVLVDGEAWPLTPHLKSDDGPSYGPTPPPWAKGADLLSDGAATERKSPTATPEWSNDRFEPPGSRLPSASAQRPIVDAPEK